MPSKSGVIGMCAAAMGIRREDADELVRLLELQFGVRSDNPGVLLKDFHTAKSFKSAYVTNRYYLSDAVFLVGLEGNRVLLEEIEEAIRHPAFPLFLGRRSCPPEGNVIVGIREKTLIDALTDEPLQLSYEREGKVPRGDIRISFDAGASSDGYTQRDAPVSFSQRKREFGFRSVKEVPWRGEVGKCEGNEHDAFGTLVEGK
jgi:CRISPR system Cascade subunit CasD